MNNDVKVTGIGSIGNYYGSLEVKVEGDKFYWAIENYDGSAWEEIPNYLYEALITFAGSS